MSTEHLRGVALVDAAMKRRREEDDEELEGMPAEELASATLGDRPLTPALRRWLEQDGEMFELGEARSFAELVDAELGEWAEAFAPVAAVLTAPCVLFEGWGADSRRFLYLGATDAHGEYPVFTVDVDDTPYVCLNGPADVWLAQQAGFLADEETYGTVPPEYEEDRQEHARLNFEGNLAWGDGVFGKTLDPFSELEDDEEGGDGEVEGEG